MLSAWFAGGVPLLPFPYLRVGVLLAKVSPEFVGCEGGLGCPSWFVILFLCLLVLHLFLELGWFLVTRWWPLLRLLVLVSSDARLRLPDALASASTPISGTLWPPGFGAVPSLHVRSPVSGTVCLLAQSTIVALLSLPWLGLLLVFVRFLCLRLTLWASACVGPHGYPPFSWVGAAPSTGVPLLWPGCVGILPPCSFSSVFLWDVVTLSGH